MTAPPRPRFRRANVPAGLAESAVREFGVPAEIWLDQIADLTSACERRFGLALNGDGYWPGSPRTLLLWCTMQDGRPAVLKLALRAAHAAVEARALAHFAGRGTVRMFGQWVVRGVVVMERLLPGDALSSLADDREALEQLGGVARTLWGPVPDDPALPTVRGWTREFARLRHRFGGTTGPMSRELVVRAEDTLRALLADEAPACLLHGDLHFANVVRAADRGWVAIDPRGVVGEPAYDVGYAVVNRSRYRPGDPSGRVEQLAERLDVLPRAAGVDPRRAAGYALVAAVLGAWWALEADERHWDWPLEMARALVARGGV